MPKIEKNGIVVVEFAQEDAVDVIEHVSRALSSLSFRDYGSTEMYRDRIHASVSSMRDALLGLGVERVKREVEKDQLDLQGSWGWVAIRGVLIEALEALGRVEKTNNLFARAQAVASVSKVYDLLNRSK